MRLELDLRGCYGIKDLRYCFGDVSLPLVIHAPNGTMKTSLKRTLDDLSKGNVPLDLVSGISATSYSVLLNGAPVPPDCIKTFAYDEHALSNLSSDVASLLASEADKVYYQAALNRYEQKKTALLQAIKPVFSNRTDTAEKSIADAFGRSMEEVLLAYSGKRLMGVSKPLVTIKKFSDAFGQAISNCIKPASEIIRKYDVLVNRALKRGGILRKGVFELADLEAVAQALVAHHFYDAGHKVLFDAGNRTREVNSSAAMDNLILKIKNSVSADPDVASVFSSLQNNLAKKGVERKPLKLIETQPLAAAYYTNYDRFQQRFVLGVFQDHKIEYLDARDALLAERKIKKILAQKAARGLTEWKDAAEEFNHRFATKYKMVVHDARGDFLTGKPAHVEFVFDGCPANSKNQDEIKGILSSGELRALFLLEVVFQSRKLLRSGRPYLLLYDDISDSFDYANKNCIMEYFKELADQNNNGCMLVLTHNFDFYRLFARRISDRLHAFFAISEGGVIHVYPGGYLKDVLNNGIITKTSSTINASFALIPFARGIVELTSQEQDVNNDEHYKFLCNLMHYRPAGARFTLGGVKKRMSFDRRIQEKIFTDGTSLSQQYYQELRRACDAIAACTTLDQKLEDKLCLSMGIRIFAEKYCYRKLSGRHDLVTALTDLCHAAFGVMLEEFKIHYPNDKKLKDLELAAMLTSTDLHLNGFAYEPLIDYSIVRMRNLYRAIVS